MVFVFVFFLICALRFFFCFGIVFVCLFVCLFSKDRKKKNHRIG